MIDKGQWEWFGQPGHLIVAQWCRFHLCTRVGQYLVSTVGEYWPDRIVREIHARIHDPLWLCNNQHLKGDIFDAAYMERFGYHRIGGSTDSIYETYVFRAGEPCKAAGCDCGMPIPNDWSELAGKRSKTSGEARKTHMEFCERCATETLGDEHD